MRSIIRLWPRDAAAAVPTPGRYGPGGLRGLLPDGGVQLPDAGGGLQCGR